MKSIFFFKQKAMQHFFRQPYHRRSLVRTNAYGSMCGFWPPPPFWRSGLFRLRPDQKDTFLEPSWSPFWGRFGLILGPLGGPFFSRFVDIFEKGENSKNRRQYCILGLFLAFPGASRRPFWAPFRHNFCAFFDVLFLKRSGAILEPIWRPFWKPY